MATTIVIIVLGLIALVGTFGLVVYFTMSNDDDDDTPINVNGTESILWSLQ